jgi:hypothetical protein
MMRLRFLGDKVMRVPVRDCSRELDPDQNSIKDAAAPAAIFPTGYKASVHGTETHVHDSEGRHIATFHSIHSLTNDSEGRLHLHAPGAYSTTDKTIDHSTALRSLNARNQDFWRRRRQ